MAKGINHLVSLVVGGWGIAPAGVGNLINGHSPELSDLGMNYPVFALNTADSGQLSKQIGWNQGFFELATGHSRVDAHGRLAAALDGGDFYQNPLWLEIAKRLKKSGGRLHVMLIWDNSQESRQIVHNLSLLSSRKKLAIFLHLIIITKDGLEEAVAGFKDGRLHIATIAAAGYLDQSLDWGKTELYHQALTRGLGYTATQPLEVFIRDEANDKVLVLTDDYGQPLSEIKESDLLVVVNDPPVKFGQIIKALSDKDFAFFERKGRAQEALYYYLLPQSGVAEERVFYQESDYPCDTVAKALLENGRSISYYAQADRPERLLSDYRGDFVPRDQETFSFINFKPDNLLESVEQQAQLVIKGVAIDLKKDTDYIIIDFSWFDKVPGRTPTEVSALIELTDRFIGAIAKEVVAAGGQMIVVSHAAMLESYLDPKTDVLADKPSILPVPFIVVSEDFLGKNISGQVFEGDWSQLTPVGSVAQVAATQLKLCGLADLEGFGGPGLI